MKKRNIILASILAMSVFASGCSKKAESNVDNDKLTVYTTVFPVYDFVRNIGQDKVNLNYIIPPGVEPHDYEITPKVLKDIQNEFSTLFHPHILTQLKPRHLPRSHWNLAVFLRQKKEPTHYQPIVYSKFFSR